MLKTSLLVTLSLSSAAAAGECAWIGDFIKGTPVPEATDCGDIHCQWDFSYRTGDARTFFSDMSQTLTACLGAHDASDDPVNHPDSYSLQQYSTGEANLYLSLKDKSSLGKTFVFLRRD